MKQQQLDRVGKIHTFMYAIHYQNLIMKTALKSIWFLNKLCKNKLTLIKTAHFRSVLLHILIIA